MSPRLLWVSFRAKGTKTFSFRDVKRRIEMMRKKEKEPEGTTKDPMCRFMKVACSMVKVFI